MINEKEATELKEKLESIDSGIEFVSKALDDETDLETRLHILGILDGLSERLNAVAAKIRNELPAIGKTYNPNLPFRKEY